jgi:uncharacterized membrane protein YbhN (UPF0104 family)
VLRYVGLDPLLAPWREVAPGSGLAAVLLMFLSYGARAARIKGYLRTDAGLSLPGCLKLTLNHNVLNNFLPMRSGEVSFPVLMSRYFGIPPGRSVPVLLWFRALDLHALLCIGGGALLWHNLGAASGVAVLVLGLPLPFLGLRLRQWTLDRLPLTASGRWARAARSLAQALPEDIGHARGALLWTWLNWCIKLAALAWVLMQFATVGLAAAIYSTILGDLTSVLPIHGAGGFGTYEAGIAAGLVPSGLDLQEALKAAVDVHLFVLGVSLTGGVIATLLPRGGHAAPGTRGA